MIPVSLFAHSGRTDGNGGHKDNKNKSGLGSYHYHCGGYPAHLHKGGQCPYNDTTRTSPSSSTKSTNNGTARPTYETTTAKFYIDENYLAVNGIVDHRRMSC